MDNHGLRTFVEIWIPTAPHRISLARQQMAIVSGVSLPSERQLRLAPGVTDRLRRPMTRPTNRQPPTSGTSPSPLEVGVQQVR